MKEKEKKTTKSADIGNKYTFELRSLHAVCACVCVQTEKK